MRAWRKEVLKRVTAEYQAGLQVLASRVVSDHRIDPAHYNTVVLKLLKPFEKTRRG